MRFLHDAVLDLDNMFSSVLHYDRIRNLNSIVGSMIELVEYSGQFSRPSLLKSNVCHRNR